MASNQPSDRGERSEGLGLRVKDLWGRDGRPWSSSDWTASDDRVRGGRSVSRLEVDPARNAARFCGTLDIKTLGGAGFASQHTVDAVFPGGGGDGLDLSPYQSLVLDVAGSDAKRYTLVLKDVVPRRMPNGREESTVSWESEFSCSAAGRVVLPFDAFRATYRGRAKPGAAPLDLKHIRRVSIMMRSYFGQQEGDFELDINTISASPVASLTTTLEAPAAITGAVLEPKLSRPEQAIPASPHQASQSRASGESELSVDVVKDPSPESQADLRAREEPKPSFWTRMCFGFRKA